MFDNTSIVLKNTPWGPIPTFLGEVQKAFPTALAVEISLGDLVGGQELGGMIQRRIQERNPNLSRLTFGEPDFLPFTFLGRGLRVGAAICRLVRQYTDSEISNLVKIIEQRNFSKSVLRELLEASNPPIEISDEFWGDHEQVADVLEAKPALRETLANKLKEAMPLVVGTGFLVGRDYLLTNHHVVSNVDELKELTAQFCYEKDALGEDLQPFEFKFDLDFNPRTSPTLDYALVKLRSLKLKTEDGENYYQDESGKQRLTFKHAGDNFGWLQMMPNPMIVTPPLKKEDISSEKILNFNDFEAAIGADVLASQMPKAGLLGDPLNLIQHPKGRRKEIVIYNNRIQKIYQHFIQYETDAEPGSSGSPLLNSHWQLVGLHHSALLEQSAEISGFLGTRISSIVGDLKAKGDQEINNFLDKFVIHPKNGRIFILAGLHRNEKLVSEPGFETTQMEVLGDMILALFQKDLLQKYGFDCYLVPQENLKTEADAIQWINQQDYRVGDVALEIVLNSSQSSEVRGTEVYYINNSTERKTHADLLLKSILGIVPDLPNRGAKSDRAAQYGSLPFCRDVLGPSLVLYLGFLTNPDDRHTIETETEKIAQGIAEGLIRWAASLTPLLSEINFSSVH